MAKQRSRRHRSRRMRGGGGATGFGESMYGNVDAQYNRVFGPEYPDVKSNTIIGAQGQGLPSTASIPSASQLSLAQGGGRRRRRGGFLGEVVNQAIVPLALLGMQQTYRRKRGGRRHTRRHSRRHRRH